VPGFAFHHEALEQVAGQLPAGDPRIQLLGSPFASLGALGPDILLYAPPSEQLATDLGDGAILGLVAQASTSPATLTAAQIQELIELFSKPIGAAYSALFSQLVVPVWPQLAEITAFLAEVDAIAQNEDELAIPGVLGKLSSILGEAGTLGSSLPPIVKSLTEVIALITTLGPWMESAPSALAGVLAPADVLACRPYELLRWHASGDFAEALVRNAKTANQQAYALGWACHVAGSVTGEPFVNNIVGGPYRTHWWRNRLAQNFVDSWIFGFVRTPGKMAGDEPTPPYEDWSSLCEANLQDAFNVGGLPGPASAGAVPSAVSAIATGDLGSLPGRFPEELTDLIGAALKEVYPQADALELGTLSAQSFAEAYVGAFGVFWFLTSGNGPLGNNLLEAAPGDCGTAAPSWITSGSAPSPQQAGLNVPAAVCAVLLAILALLSFLTGDVVGGMAALAAALAAPVIDWDEVRCNLWWIESVLLKQENLLRDALVFGGLAYPPPVLLGGPDLNGNTQPATDLTPDPNLQAQPPQPEGNVPPSTGVPLTRSNSLSADKRDYPRALDDSVQGTPDLDFQSYPLSVGAETPATENLIAQGEYPSVVFNGTGVQNGGVADAGVYPSRYELLGDAVANALALLGDMKLANYNLDGDRGYGWLAWHPEPGTDPATPPVHDVQD
jgi:hypothetical protein